ncbi:MAG: hypothetical protein JNL10_08090 [Verrucomicrobiales bacterium]|nr:hypothetical protein [Verrucomicrobiales bacterium]
MSVVAAFTEFRAEVAILQGFVARAFTQDSGGAYLLSSQERSFVVDSAFLRIFIAWEGFLEKAFISYLLGNPSSSGKGAVRYVAPTSVQHARDILIGAQKYVDGANPEIVRKLARLYLANGEPIEPVISSLQADLFDLKTVRNAAAHLTSTTGKLLDSLASRRLGRVCTNISVSDFILSRDPTAGAGGSVLDSYIKIMDAGAYNIANWA